MIEQDVTEAMEEIGYLFTGSYPAQPWLIAARCSIGVTITDRSEALWFIEQAQQAQRQRDAHIRLAMQQNDDDNAY